MKKVLRKISILDELAKEMQVIGIEEQRYICGGTGGYGTYYGGELPEVVVYGSYNDGFNIHEALNHLTSNALSNSSGYCARYVREALEAGGLSTYGRPVSACDYDTYLSMIGFSIVDSSNYTPQEGDIVVHEATSGHSHGHIAMYNGNQWISDFIQNDMYGGSAYRDNPNYTVLRWNP